MTKQLVIGKIKFILGIAILFLISFILQVNFAVPLFLIGLVIYLKSSYPDFNRKSYKLLNLTFLFVIILALASIITRSGWSIFLIPFCMVPMLAIILFEERVIALSITVACAVTIASVAGASFYLLMLFLVSGILSVILLPGARRRSQIIRAGAIIGIFQAITLFFLEHFRVNNPANYPLLFLNGICSSFIVAGILPVFEYLFDTVTNISLLELADFDNPILQRMMMEAPGTYHHSLIVGNLSEAAAQAVGAHALLARIGAYYHDIGKLSKPEYFSENQDIYGSKHDSLSAAMSKMIIMNHVKEGMELAKKQRLKPQLLDFIQQHHGTSLVYYFYRRALENVEDDQKIQEEGFRYPGPKPTTRESAIVLLADSVEAATRTLKEPTVSNIEDLVHKVINNKFIDGQLDECDLTLKDLEIIAVIFSRILGGIYHSRVTYP
jgi:hypothetical protein